MKETLPALRADHDRLARSLDRVRVRLAFVLGLIAGTGMRIRRGRRGLVWSWKGRVPRGRVWSLRVDRATRFTWDESDVSFRKEPNRDG